MIRLFDAISRWCIPDGQVKKAWVASMHWDVMKFWMETEEGKEQLRVIGWLRDEFK